jgi:hypothetical protein
MLLLVLVPMSFFVTRSYSSLGHSCRRRGNWVNFEVSQRGSRSLSSSNGISSLARKHPTADLFFGWLMVDIIMFCRNGKISQINNVLNHYVWVFHHTLLESMGLQFEPRQIRTL